MIKINLVREGRAVRGAGAAPAGAPAAAAAAGGGGSNLNNIVIIALTVLGLAAAGGYWFIEERKLAEREEMVRSRQAEADKLELIIKAVADYQKQKDNLQKRIDLINQLKLNQKGPVRIMDRISQDLPDLVWLDKMQLAGGVITLNGRSLNPNAVANFVDNIKNDPMFEEPALNNLVQATVIPPVYTFDMSFRFTYAPKTATATTASMTTSTGGTTSTSGTTGRASTSTAQTARPKG